MLRAASALSTGRRGLERPVAEGDFNGHGKSDVTLHNAAQGQWQFVLMDGLNTIASSSYSWGAGGWDVATTKLDLNADLKSDVLLHNLTTGEWHFVLMDGVNVVARQGGSGPA